MAQTQERANSMCVCWGEDVGHPRPGADRERKTIVRAFPMTAVTGHGTQ